MSNKEKENVKYVKFPYFFYKSILEQLNISAELTLELQGGQFLTTLYFL